LIVDGTEGKERGLLFEVMNRRTFPDDGKMTKPGDEVVASTEGVKDRG
jgi:hypothetical protein